MKISEKQVNTIVEIMMDTASMHKEELKLVPKENIDMVGTKKIPEDAKAFIVMVIGHTALDKDQVNDDLKLAGQALAFTICNKLYKNNQLSKK